MNVTVGMNTDGNVTSATLMSLCRMFNAYPEDFNSRLIMVDGGCADFAGSRNKLVEAFLTTGSDYLLILDADMVFTPEDYGDLAQHATSDVVSAGLYFVQGKPLRPCCAIIAPDGKAASPVLVEEDHLVRVSAAGLGFSLIHRNVWLATKGDSDHPWFQHGWTTPAGETMPEDYAFAWRCQEAGIPVYLNARVRVGHVKSRIIGWEDYAGQAEV